MCAGKYWTAIPAVQSMLRNLKAPQVLFGLMESLSSPSASGTGSALSVLRACHAALQAFCSCNPENQRIVWRRVDLLQRHLVCDGGVTVSSARLTALLKAVAC